MPRKESRLQSQTGLSQNASGWVTRFLGLGFLTLLTGMTSPLYRAASGFSETCVPALSRCTHHVIALPCEKDQGLKARRAGPSAGEEVEAPAGGGVVWQQSQQRQGWVPAVPRPHWGPPAGNRSVLQR